MIRQIKKTFEDPRLRFIISFLFCLPALYYFNIIFFGITSAGNYYSPFLDEHLNYIRLLRGLLLGTSRHIINWLGFEVLLNDSGLLVPGHSPIRVVYSCLGLGVMSFFTSFVLAFPKTLKQKFTFLIPGLIGIQALNVLRFVLLALFWNNRKQARLDHHMVFNIAIYLIVGISLYFWAKQPKPKGGTRFDSIKDESPTLGKS